MKNYIELDQGEIKYIPSKTIVDLGTFGPCIGVLIHDKKNCQGYAGHFENINPFGELEKMIENSLNFGDFKNLRVYCLGGSVYTDLKEKINYEKEFILDTFKKNGFKDTQMYIRWSPPHCGVSFEFWMDNSKNKFVLSDAFNETVYYEGNIRKLKTSKNDEIILNNFRKDDDFY